MQTEAAGGLGAGGGGPADREEAVLPPEEEPAPEGPEVPEEESAPEEVSAPASEDRASPRAAGQGVISGSAIRWELSGGTLTLSGNGPMPKDSLSTPPWDKSGGLYLVVEEGVTTISPYAFNYCKNPADGVPAGGPGEHRKLGLQRLRGLDPGGSPLHAAGARRLRQLPQPDEGRYSRLLRRGGG